MNATQYLRNVNRRSPNPAKARSVLVYTTYTGKPTKTQSHKAPGRTGGE